MLMDVLSGLICGLLMGSVFLGALIYLFLTNRDIYERLAKRLPAGIPPTLVMLSLVVGVPPAWTIFGAIAGALYHMAADTSQGAGLGSSSSIFTLAILCITVLLMLPALFFVIRRKKLGWLFLGMDLIFAGIFGWLLPLLAHWR
jgi:LPXTG-motif cell wall-anchored protein